ncbi:MAG: hypothetical protein GX957_13840 [Clostridiaceae bacterium]|nr:hypothetical protein [Clostridiaceae bacterium]
MVFYTRIKGKVIDEKVSKKGRRYLKVYDGNNLVNVFVEKDSLYSVGDEVDINCVLYTNDVYITEFKG